VYADQLRIGGCVGLSGRLEVEVAVPLGREEEVVKKDGCSGSLVGGLVRFGGVVGWWVGCEWDHQTEDLG